MLISSCEYNSIFKTYAMFIDVHKDKSDNFEITDFAMELLEKN